MSLASAGAAVLIIGANSTIAQALLRQLLKNANNLVIAVSRVPLNDERAQHNLHWLQCDYSESSISTIVATCQQILQRANASLAQVFVFNGVLHQQSLQPEKSLNQFKAGNFLNLINSNAILPMNWLTQLPQLIDKHSRCIVTVLSARLASITDNRLGGWYSYRASKAALNMLVVCAAIELQRQFKKLHFLLYHPGTTCSPLSAPYTSNSNRELFDPQTAAQHLQTVIAGLSDDEKLVFKDWQGRTIAW